MDRKSVLILVASFALLVLWYPLVNRIYPPIPVTPEELATNQPPAMVAGTGTSNAVAPVQAVTPLPPPPGVPFVGGLPVATAAEQTVVLENEAVRYEFTSHGGGLKSVALKKYPETVGRRARRPGQTNDVASLNEGAPVPALSLLGGESLVGDGQFELTRRDGMVRAEKSLPGGLRLIKEFRPGTNYLLGVTVRVENTSSQRVTLPVQELVVGTATPMSGTDNGTLMKVLWYDGAKAQSVMKPWFDNAPAMGCGLVKGSPRYVYVEGASNVVWASAQNQFFTMLAFTPTNAPAPRIAVRHLDLPPPSAEALQTDRQLHPTPFAFQTAFLYPEMALDAGQALERHVDLFTGPKEYRTLDRLASRLGNKVDLVMDFGWFSGFFAKGLLLSMNGLHGLGLSYGLAIVAITFIIKLLFWPLTQASMRSMKRMQQLQPKMKELQEKYKDDSKKMNEKLMLFMKEHKINPAAGCLPILIQIPIFMGFFYMLQSAIELRGASFLWAYDLSQPDTIWVIPGLGFPLNPLPILMGLTQFWQMKMTPPSPGMDPVQQKIFQYMPLIFLFILYNFSSGLTLYWTVQNLLSIAQMKLTKATGEPVPAHKPAAHPARKPRH